LVFHNQDDVQSSQEVKMAAESVVLTPECVECQRVSLPSDREHWEAYPAYVTDEPPELVFYYPECAEREFGSE
jgi:hypothetical protein